MEAKKPLNLWVMSAEYKPYITGGLGTVATYLTQELGNSGIKVTVITKTPSAAVSIASEGNVTVVRFPERYNTSKIVKFMAKKSFLIPEVVHIHSLQYVRLLRRYKKRANIPAVYTCHSLVLKRGSNSAFTPRRQARLLRSAERIIVPSGSEYTRLVRKYPFCARKTAIITHGVRGDVSATTASTKYRLLYAGRLVRDKGLEQLIDAMPILRRGHPRVQLFIIGKGKGPYVRKLKLRTSRRRVSRIVHWLGHYGYERLQSAYGRFGAVVMPSRAESFGLVALEALAHGVPLIATQAGGLRHFVTREVAQVIPRVDGAALAAAIATMWRSPNLTKARVEAGRQLSLNYQWPHAAQRYAEILIAVSKARIGGRQ